jgi:glycoside/pentoside/hexuronide:cation symporter, GPH family
MAVTADRIETAPPRLSWATCFWFGLGTNGTSTLIGVTGIFLLFYMTTMLGIDAAVAGGLIFAVKMYDLVIHPVLGHLSDRTQSRLGRRRPYLFVGAFMAGLSCYTMFAVPRIENEVALLAYYSAMLLLFATGYSIFSVPYLSMPAEMTTDYHERTRLMSFRTLFGAVGLLFGTAIAPLIVGLASPKAAAGAAAAVVLRPDDPTVACVMGTAAEQRAGGTFEGYAVMGAVLGLIVFASMMLCFFGTARAPFAQRTESSAGLLAQIRVTLRNRPFVLLVTGKILQLTGVTAFSASLAFFAQYVVQMTGAQLGMFFGLFSLGTMLSIPAWVAAARRFGKKHSYVVAVSLFICFDLCLLAAGKGTVGLVLGLGFMIGVSGGGLILLGVSMLPDTIEYDFRTTGVRREGVYAGVWSTIETASAGVATLLTGLLLSGSGFIKTTAGQMACQPQSAVDAIALAVAVTPAVLMAISLLFLTRYDLTQERLAALRDQPA